MTFAPVIVVGAGGHAMVVADALLSAGRKVIGFVDADEALHGQKLMGLTVLGNDEDLARFRASPVELANGVGGDGRQSSVAGGLLRRRIQERLQADGWIFATVCHSSAIVSACATIDAGAQVLAGAVVQPFARVCEGAIVNTRAVVEHHCRVGSFAHVAPGAVLCGGVEVGNETHVGASAVVRQGIKLGERVVVAMGAAVLRDVTSGMVGGVPARPLTNTV